MCFCFIDQFPGFICFVFDCVIHEDNYSCLEICTCLSYYAYWNDWTQTVFYLSLINVKISNIFCGYLSGLCTSPWTKRFSILKQANMIFTKNHVYPIFSTYSALQNLTVLIILSLRGTLTILSWSLSESLMSQPTQNVLRFRLKDANEHTCQKVTRFKRKEAQN